MFLITNFKKTNVFKWSFTDIIIKRKMGLFKKKKDIEEDRVSLPDLPELEEDTSLPSINDLNAPANLPDLEINNLPYLEASSEN